jgi:hypothetical protein
MRAGRRSVALVALGIWPVACAVYNEDSLMPTGGSSLGGDAVLGGSGGSGPSLGQGGNNSASSGNMGKSGGGSPGTAGSASGGRVEPGGGTSAAEGGDAAGGAREIPKAGSGSGGSAGAGGHGGTSAGAGSGGVSGTGGGGGTGGKAGGGAAGTGGMPSGPLCSDHLLTTRSSWVASASHYDSTNSGVPANLLDNSKTRWSTGKAQSGNEWLQIDFGKTVTLNHVNLQQGDDINDYPRGYSIIVSDTPKDLNGAVQLSGSGKSGVSTAILLPALASGRYLLIKQTGSSLSWWSAEELEVSCAD